MEPAEIPVMLAERPIVVFGKVPPGPGRAAIELTGATAQDDYRANLSLADEAAVIQPNCYPSCGRGSG